MANEGADVLLTTGIDNSGLKVGFGETLNMVDRFKAQIDARLGVIGKGTAVVTGAAGFGKVSNEMERMVGLSGRLGQALDKLTGTFTGGLGIGVALGSMAALTGMFTRAIEKAREFQTSQLAIAATIQSSYKIIGGVSGKELTGMTGFMAAQEKAQKLNMDIIRRQAENILTYQEELTAFQASLAPGARKGLSPEQVLDISEQAAIVAKSIGLRGEQIANAARLIMGGGVNVARSTIGRVLGVSNQDILGLQGAEFEKFIMDKMKGFKAAQPTFAKSIEGIISTLEAQLDVFFARIGSRFMDKITGAIQNFGKVLEGPGGKQMEDTLVGLFEGIFKGLEKIATSPAIPIIMNLFEFLAGNADKIVIGAAILTLGKVILGVASASKELIGWFMDMTKAARETAAAITNLAAANKELAASEAAAAGAGGVGAAGAALAGRRKGAAVIDEVLAEEAILSAAFAKTGGKFLTPGGGAIRLTRAQEKALQRTKLSGRAGLAGTFMAQNVAGEMDANFAAWQAQQIQLEALGGAAGAAYMAGKVPGIISPAQRAALQERMTAIFGEGWLANKATNLVARFPGLPGALSTGVQVAGQMSGNLLKGLIATQLAGMLLPATVQANPLVQMGMTGIPAYMALAPLAAKSAGMGAMWGTGALGTSVMGAGPLAAAAAAAIAYKSWNDSELAKAEEQARASEDAWQQMRKQYPLASKKVELREQLGWLEQQRKDPTTNLTKRTIDAQIAATKAKLAEVEDQQKAVIKASDELSKAQTMETDAKALAAVAQIGYGPERAKQRVQANLQANLAKIQELYGKGELAVDEDVRGRILVDLFTRNSALAKKYAPKEGRKLTASDIESIVKAEGQDVMKARLEQEAQQRAADEQARSDMQKKQLMAGLKPQTLRNQLEQGLLGVEAGLMGQKELLGDDYERVLKLAKEKFKKEFNLPLKEVETKLQALSLGVSAENVVEQVKLAFEATTLKLKEMIDVPKTIRDKMQAQAFRQMEVDLALAYDQLAHQSYGGNDLDRITGRGISQMRINEANRQGTLAGAFNMPMSQQMYGTIADIEQKRAMFNPTELNRYAQAMFENLFRSMAEAIQQAAFSRRQADLAVTQAHISQKSFDYNLTEMDQRAQAAADRQARSEMAEERGAVSYSERLQLAREKLKGERDSLQLNAEMAEAQRQSLQRLKSEDKVRQDYIAAMKAYTEYLNGMVGGKKQKVGEGSAKTVTNKVDVKVDPKVSLTPKEVDALATEVKDKICKAFRGK